MSLIDIYDDVLDLRLVEQTYSIMKHWLMPPNLFWIDRRHLARGTVIAYVEPYVGPIVGRFLENYLRAVSRCVTPETLDATAGFEVWTGVTTAGQSRFFLHIDVDEFERQKRGTIRHPIRSCIFHLGPSKGLGGGATYFARDTDALAGRCFRHFDRRSLLGLPSSWRIIRQRQNRLIVADGAIAHAVEPVRAHPNGEPRVAILVNMWGERISSARQRNFSRLTANEFKVVRDFAAEEARVFVLIGQRIGPRGMTQALTGLRKIVG